jgi:uncharacterized protein YjiS (DUF1127 family)
MEMVMRLSRAVERRYAAVRDPLASMVAAIRKLCAAYVIWRMEQSAIAVLRSMTDRQLSDIGLSRSDITRAVRPSGAPIGRAAASGH